MAQIQVSPRFADDFKALARFASLPDDEVRTLRERVRSDFAAWAPWVTEQVRLHRYARQIWYRIPTIDECREILGDDAPPEAFEREGIMLLVKRCADKDRFVDLGGLPIPG